MMAWKSVRAGIAGQILQPERLLLPAPPAQDAFPRRQGTDPRLGLFIDAHGDELTQPLPVFVEHPDRPVLGPEDLARQRRNLLEDRSQRQLLRQDHAGLHQGPELLDAPADDPLTLLEKGQGHNNQDPVGNWLKELEDLDQPVGPLPELLRQRLLTYTLERQQGAEDVLRREAAKDPSGGHGLGQRLSLVIMPRREAGEVGFVNGHRVGLELFRGPAPQVPPGLHLFHPLTTERFLSPLEVGQHLPEDAVELHGYLPRVGPRLASTSLHHRTSLLGHALQKITPFSRRGVELSIPANELRRNSGLGHSRAGGTGGGLSARA